MFVLTVTVEEGQKIEPQTKSPPPPDPPVQPINALPRKVSPTPTTASALPKSSSSTSLTSLHLPRPRRATGRNHGARKAQLQVNILDEDICGSLPLGDTNLYVLGEYRHSPSIVCHSGTSTQECITILNYHKWNCFLKVFQLLWSICFFIGPESDHCLPLSLTHSLTHWLTHSLLFSKLDWCDPGVWKSQLKTFWGCYYC